MTLTLAPIAETRLLALAERRGQTPEAVIDAFIAREATEAGPLPLEDAAPAVQTLSPTAAIFAQWAEEDRTDDPEEIARRQRDGDELLASLQENHLSLRRLGAQARDRVNATVK